MANKKRTRIRDDVGFNIVNYTILTVILLIVAYKGLISEAGVIELVEGVNTVSIRLAAPVDRDMFRFAYLTLRRKQA